MMRSSRWPAFLRVTARYRLASSLADHSLLLQHAIDATQHASHMKHASLKYLLTNTVRRLTADHFLCMVTSISIDNFRRTPSAVVAGIDLRVEYGTV